MITRKTKLKFFVVVLLTVSAMCAASCAKPENDSNDNGNNSSGQGGGNNGGNTGMPGLPSVQTLSVSNITTFSATVDGIVDDGGGSLVTERGFCWSSTANPTISGNHSVCGNGMGTFSTTINGLSQGSTYHVRAYAVNSAGTEYGTDMSFTTTAPSTYPNGVLPGVFTIGYGKKVRFSQGNLQYIGSGGYWRFADHQWEILGNNAQCSSSQDASRDLFGWGTSGWNNGNTYYMPYDVGGNWEQYGPSDHLTGRYASADWGVYNPIVNGGNQAGLWRTMTYGEWSHVLKKRSASSVNGVNNARFIFARVNGRFGIVLFPDVYSHPASVTQPKKQNINNDYVTTDNFNSYDGFDWLQMEEAGCVFLPVTGIRGSSNGYLWEDSGCYWSASFGGHTGFAYYLSFTDYTTYNISGGTIDYDTSDVANAGRAVRLVQEY